LVGLVIAIRMALMAVQAITGLGALCTLEMGMFESLSAVSLIDAVRSGFTLDKFVSPSS